MFKTCENFVYLLQVFLTGSRLVRAPATEPEVDTV